MNRKPKRPEKSFYPLSRFSHYLLCLVNAAWTGWNDEKDPRPLLQQYRGLLLERFRNEGNALSQRERYLRRYLRCYVVGFRVFERALFTPSGFRALLEAKFYLSMLADNTPPLSKGSSIRALMDFLYQDIDMDRIRKLWETRRTGVPFNLDKKATLKPHINPDNPVASIWGLTAFFLVEANQDFRRLKLCTFRQNGKRCLNIFWDESKNRVKKHCDQEYCQMARLRAKVRKHRKKKKLSKKIA